MADPKTVRILSIDGGGVRGIMPSVFLNRFCPLAGVNPSRIFDSFDIISGTSIGSLIALGVAFGKTPSEMKQFFYDKSANIFYYKPGILSLTLAAYKANVILGTPTYNSTYYGVGNHTSPMDASINGLRVAISSIFGEDLRMSDLPSRLIIPSWNAHQDKPVLFSNVSQLSPYLTGHDQKVVDVGLASASAPIYFPSVLINGEKHIDGGVFQNNPSMIAYTVAKRLFPTTTRFCVLSLGTGIAYNEFIPPTLRQNLELLTPHEQFICRELEKALEQKAKELILQYPEKEEFIKREELRAKEQIYGASLSQNTDYILYLMDNVFITGPQEAVSQMMDFIATDLYDDIFHYRFQYPFQGGQNADLDKCDPSNLALLESYANQQFDSDQFKINAFINHFQAG